MTAAVTTTDHQEIRSWAEERGGRPALVRASQPGVLRIDFGEPDENLEEISWDDFFQLFDRNDLAFLYQEETERGGKSRFNKFVDRDG